MYEDTCTSDIFTISYVCEKDKHAIHLMNIKNIMQKVFMIHSSINILFKCLIVFLYVEID